jgi:hypothetical protein
LIEDFALRGLLRGVDAVARGGAGLRENSLLNEAGEQNCGCTDPDGNDAESLEPHPTLLKTDSEAIITGGVRGR